jgi:putative transposase
MGLLIAVVVHAADIQDVVGARLLLGKLQGLLPRMKLIWADGGYVGSLIEWVRSLLGWTLEIVKRDRNLHTFVVLPRRWVVERTFAWLGRYRRLSKDYEYRTERSEAMIYLVMTQIMVRRLARQQASPGP